MRNHLAPLQEPLIASATLKKKSLIQKSGRSSNPNLKSLKSFFLPRFPCPTVKGVAKERAQRVGHSELLEDAVSPSQKKILWFERTLRANQSLRFNCPRY